LALEQHPGWLLILDNVDDPTAAAAIEKLLARPLSGQVLITGRAANFSAAIDTLPLDVLKLEDASAFLIQRTQGRRASEAAIVFTALVSLAAPVSADLATFRHPLPRRADARDQTGQGMDGGDETV
jgi:hypothetical protein